MDTDSATDTAAGRPARRAAATSATPQCNPPAPAWFEAATPFGALHLCVRATGPVRHAAAAAAALHEVAPLLDAFDDWSLLDVDWRWTAATPDAAPASGSHGWADWHAAADTPPAARLHLPWPLLRQLPPPPATVAPQLRWQALPAAVVVARVPMDAHDLAALERGGALILPESMQPRWQGVLRAAEEPCGAGVLLTLQTPQAPAVLERGAEAAHAAVDASRPIVCEVRLDGMHALGADCLAGWVPGALDAAGSRASLWRCVGPSGAAQPLACGRLMPWGDGWALALDSVFDDLHREAAPKD